MDNIDEKVNPYDRILVVVDGDEQYVRPIEFEMDKDENPTKAIKWEAVNPKNGQLLQFIENEIVIKDGKKYYKEFVEQVEQDSSIKIGRKLKIMKEPSKVVEANKDVKPVEVECPFIDPIEMGLFKL